MAAGRSSGGLHQFCIKSVAVLRGTLILPRHTVALSVQNWSNPPLLCPAAILKAIAPEDYNRHLRRKGRSTTRHLRCFYTYPDISWYPDVSAPDRPSVYTKTIQVHAIRRNTLSGVFENSIKGGSSAGCPGALQTRVHGISVYLDLFHVHAEDALCGFIQLETS